MDRSTHAKAMTAIQNVIPEINDEGIRPPYHLLARMAVLLVGDDPVWGSMRSEAGEVREAVIYTPNRVIHAALVPAFAGLMNVQTFPRASLMWLSLDGSAPDQWETDWGSVWTDRGRIDAGYRDGGSLRLPMSSQPIGRNLRALFDEFLPTLISDLDR